MNTTKLERPFEYTLRITKDSEMHDETVDLVETFNYLLGLKVKRIRTFAENGTTYRIVHGETLERSGNNGYLAHYSRARSQSRTKSSSKKRFSPIPNSKPSGYSSTATSMLKAPSPSNPNSSGSWEPERGASHGSSKDKDRECKGQGKTHPPGLPNISSSRDTCTGSLTKRASTRCRRS